MEVIDSANVKPCLGFAFIIPPAAPRGRDFFKE